MIDRDSRAFRLIVDLHEIFKVEERLAVAQKYLDEERSEAQHEATLVLMKETDKIWSQVNWYRANYNALSATK